MTPKFIAVNNIQIAYLEVNPDKESTIFFIHGNSGSSHSWRRQLNEPLLNDFRMIAFDLPAHGDSSGSINPDDDYNLPALGHLVADVVTALSGTNKFILTGFSLGANVLAESLNWLKPDGIVLSGSSVAGGDYTMDKIFQPGLDGSVFFSDAASVESITNFASDIQYKPSAADKQASAEDYHKVKAGFRPTFFKNAMEGKMSDEIALLVQYGQPVLVVFGLDDKMANPNYLNDAPFNLWKNKVFQLPEAAHAVHLDQPSIFNASLLEYSKERMGLI